MTSTTITKSAKKPPPEERRNTRERTFLPARIAFGDGGALSAQCTVTQLSAIGARVNIPSSVAMPDRFDFAIPQRGLSQRARLIWRKDDQAGIEFDEPNEEFVALSSEELRARIRKLEATNAKLRRQVAELVLQVNRLTEI
jgi:hypothetical protein